MLKKIILFSILFSALSILLPVYAQKSESTLSAEFLKIDNPSNHFDRLLEKITLLTKFGNESKAKYMMTILDKRLADLYIVVQKDRGNLIEEISSRYASYTGELGSFYSDNELKDKEISKKIQKHKEILIEIQKKYSNESPFRMLLQHDINTLDLIEDKL